MNLIQGYITAKKAELSTASNQRSMRTFPSEKNCLKPNGTEEIATRSLSSTIIENQKGLSMLTTIQKTL